MKKFLLLFTISALVLSAPQKIYGQQRILSDCFSAFHITLPFDHGALQQLEKSSDDAPVIKYLFEDQYTFWYRFESSVTDSVGFTIWPSDISDHFQAVVYQSNDSLFCRALVAGDVKPEQIISTEIIIGNESGQSAAYQYKVLLEEGETYFLSVLSLNQAHCGHRLEVNFGNDRVFFHAMNKPCYNFSAIDFLQQPELIADIDPVIELSIESDLISPVSFRQDSFFTDVQSPVDLKKENTSLPEPINTPDTQLANLELKTGVTLNLEKVYFHNNTYAFRDGSERQLQALADLLKTHPDVEIEIAGHSAGNSRRIQPDPFYSHKGEAWNFSGSAKKLSRMRAEAVRSFLVQQGISTGRLKAVGYGDANKLVKNPKTPEEHRQNMRVEIKIISAD